MIDIDHFSASISARSAGCGTSSTSNLQSHKDEPKSSSPELEGHAQALDEDGKRSQRLQKLLSRGSMSAELDKSWKRFQLQHENFTNGLVTTIAMSFWDPGDVFKRYEREMNEQVAAQVQSGEPEREDRTEAEEMVAAGSDNAKAEDTAPPPTVENSQKQEQQGATVVSVGAEEK
mmetsp:Transcript_1973/g.4572  ORF Transcript_1973/g.4572 Transcript_1973/m.4572 type:complete len:175 (-) Transcript_1973:335-859(-)|eukprot:CAMPEP_0178994526 /NCGR_PEP_ID=MMETSP0795-20121207/7320_1 /TAXON_ID=88552 /ORGANISM="Amoebophrya sp., Strain Ameob2" /LENGTH=174 /DNA_ID=CAMNT_0020686731 /DNA_START=123 /DNA_END=647 /DNA_ORIENTATION=+